MALHSLGKPFLFALVLTLLACTTPGTNRPEVSEKLTAQEKRAQQALHVQRVVAYQAQLEQVAAPLLQAALPFCEGQESGYIGARVDNIDAWSAGYQMIARDVLQLDQALKVTMVTPDSPARRAGLQVGDLLLSVNGRATIAGQGAVKDYNQLIRTAMRKGSASHIRLQVSRGGQELSIEVRPQPMCNYTVHVLMNNAINAFATGELIAVTSGLIRFAESDGEIAMVLAHEIAHNSMEHIEAKVHNAQMASVFDIIAAAYGVNTQGMFAKMGANSFSKDFEREADYLGMYIMARAGVSVDGLDDFWRRMAAEDPASNRDSIFRTHPISAERTLALRQTMEEIAAKRSDGRPLMPERKE